MSRARLFDVEQNGRRTGFSKALVPVDTSRCPECGTALDATTIHEPALLRHGGYGATARTTVVHCPNSECRWWMETERTEINPRNPSPPATTEHPA